MELELIWINIILPILIGPFIIILKFIYEKHLDRVNLVKLNKYSDLKTILKNKLDIFYWPLYLRLLCIYQINHLIPEMREYCDNYLSNEISLSIDNSLNYSTKQIGNSFIDLYYNKNTDKLKLKQNEYCIECKKIIEKYIYICCPDDLLGSELINFVNHINISIIIDDKGEIKHNITALLSLVEKEVYTNQANYNNLINNGPYNYK